MKQMRSLSVLLSDTFRIFTNRFKDIFLPLLIYAAIYAVVEMFFGVTADIMSTLTTFVSGGASLLQLPALLVPMLPFFIVATLLQLFVYPLMVATVYTVQFSEIEGMRRDWSQALSTAKKNYKRMVFTSLAIFAASIVITLALVLAASVLSFLGSALMAIVMLGVSFLFMVISVAIGFAYPVTMAQNKHGFAAVRHSFDIMLKGRFGRNLGYAIVLSLIVSVATSVVTNLFGVFTPSILANQFLLMAVIFVLSIVSQLVLGIMIVGTGFLYINAQVDYDYRMGQQER